MSLIRKNGKGDFQKNLKENKTDRSIADQFNDDEYILHLAAIVESSDDAIISKSLDGIIKSWNNGSEKMFGYSNKEAVGKHISLIIPPEYLNEEKTIIERIRHNEMITHFETVRRKKNGEHFYVSLSVSPLKDHAGNILGVSKIARDITAQKKSEREYIRINKELIFENEEKGKRAAELGVANIELIFQNEEKEKRAAELIIANAELAFQNEEKGKRAAELIIANKKLALENEEKIDRTAQLESANKELESFSYSVSHDLRAPLRAIHGYARMLKETWKHEDAEANRMMNNIINNAKKMGQLIDDLLTFSRLGRKELIKIPVAINELVTTLCEELKNEQQTSTVEFHIENLLPSQADAIAIKQVWLNLISNAIKYSRLKEKTIIEIKSEKKDNEIIYSVKDNGAGFDMRYAAKLFGVFQRLHSDDEFEGTGVGLAIVKRIIAKHGGRVWAESEVNKGATFFFTLNKL